MSTHSDYLDGLPVELGSVEELPQDGGQEQTMVRKSLVRKVRSPSKAFLKGADYDKLQRRTTSIFKYAPTERSALFEVSDDVVDPLVQHGTMGWRQYTGFITYMFMTIASPIIGFTFFNIIQIRASDISPSNWWKCGLFCGFVQSFILNAFIFEIIRKKIRSISVYSDFHPSWIRFIVCWLLVAVFMGIFWAFLQLIDNKLIWMHGGQAAVVGLISGPILQCMWITPESFTRQEMKESLIITLATGVMFIPIQGIFLSLCLVVYNYFNKALWTLIPFYVVRMVADSLAEFVCKHGRALSFRIIFINVNALMNRLLLCYTLASDSNILAIMTTVALDFMIVLMFSFLVTGPLYVYRKSSALPYEFVRWICGKSDISENEKQLGKEERKEAISERAKWVYFMVLHSTGEIIMPWWQMFFYYLLSSTPSKSALAGFERSVNGFPLISPANLLKTALIMSTFDILDLIMFTCIVRRKFVQFTPWRFLNVIIKKYNLLLALSVMSVVISIQCILLIDCRFVYSFSAVEDFFTPEKQPQSLDQLW